MVLHALLAEREKADRDMALLCFNDKAEDKPNLDPDRDIEFEYVRLDKLHDRKIIWSYEFTTSCCIFFHAMPRRISSVTEGIPKFPLRKHTRSATN